MKILSDVLTFIIVFNIFRMPIGRQFIASKTVINKYIYIYIY